MVLAVPHLIALYVLGIAAAVVAVIGWAGALAAGRLPRFAAAYLSGYLRWYCRAGAYLLLLAGEYPRFGFADAPYPVRVSVSPGKLSRLSVLFRGLLAIPAAVVSLLLAAGVTIVAFIAWLTALVAGRLPGPLHQALAAVLRYAARCCGYQYLLTGAYPAGLFGDKPGSEAEFPGPTGSWTLALAPGAKRLTRLILALGVLAGVGGGGAWAGIEIHAARVRAMEIKQLDTDVARHNSAVAKNNSAVTREQAAAVQASSAVDRLGAANDTLNSQLDAAVQNIQACGTLSCMDAAALPAAKAFGAFGRTLRATPIPSSAAAAASRLAADNTANERGWTSMANSASFTDYENTATAAEKPGGNWDNDYPVLVTALNQAGETQTSLATRLNAQAAVLERAAAALSHRAVALNVPVGLAHVDEANPNL